MKYRIQGKNFAFEIPFTRLVLAMEQAVFQISEEHPASSITIVEIDDNDNRVAHDLDKLLLRFPSFDWMLEVRRRLIEEQKTKLKELGEIESKLLELEREIGKQENGSAN